MLVGKLRSDDHAGSRAFRWCTAEPRCEYCQPDSRRRLVVFARPSGRRQKPATKTPCVAGRGTPAPLCKQEATGSIPVGSISGLFAGMVCLAVASRDLPATQVLAGRNRAIYRASALVVKFWPRRKRSSDSAKGSVLRSSQEPPASLPGAASTAVPPGGSTASVAP